MKLVAIVGSPRKHKATDTLVDKAIEGALARHQDLECKKIHLIDRDIKYCQNCLACRDSNTKEAVAPCTIHDDMDLIRKDLLETDLLVFGTPLHMGYPTAIMMTFLSRICWTFAKPERKILTISGCPLPRSDKKRRAIKIITNSIVPPVYRLFCDNATPLIRQTVRDSLNGKMTGSLYAGAIEARGVEFYFGKAYKLGLKL